VCRFSGSIYVPSPIHVFNRIRQKTEHLSQRLRRKSKKRRISDRPAGLDPASSSETLKKKLDSLRGEFIEPRVKPGMTKQQYILFCY
jgi:hypothetical protein